MKIVVLGPQGSGKGTQAERLAEHFGLPHIDAGQLLRNEIEKKTLIGQKIEKLMAAGKSVPVNVSEKLVKMRLQEPDAAKGWILDGYPRDLVQAEFLDGLEELDAVIFIDIPDKLAVERLSKRRFCPKDHSVYGLGRKPRKAGVCDNDSAKLVHRDDDKPEAIKKRLEWYHDATEPLMEYYKPRDLVRVVDGTKAPDEVFRLILEELRTVA